MPDLFYGRYGEETKPRLYTPGMDRVVSEVFDNFKLRSLAPAHRKLHIANFWWWRRRKHTIIAWHDDSLKEAKVFIPTLLNQRQALEYARDLFAPVMPSAITFRFNQDYHEALLYD